MQAHSSKIYNNKFQSLLRVNSLLQNLLSIIKNRHRQTVILTPPTDHMQHHSHNLPDYRSFHPFHNPLQPIHKASQKPQTPKCQYQLKTRAKE